MSELAHRVQRAAQNLAERLERLDRSVASAAEALRATGAGIEADLAREELEVLVVGHDVAARRAFLNSIIGADLLPLDVQSPDDVRIVIRHGREPNYRVRLRDERVIAFDEALPDRSNSFDNAIARADREKASARLALIERKTRLDELTVSASSGISVSASTRDDDVEGTTTGLTHPAKNATGRRRVFLALRALLHAILVFLGIRRRKRAVVPAKKTPRLPPLPRPVPVLEKEIAATSARADRASAQALRLHQEREKYAEERLREFERDVGAFADRDARGGELIELAIEYPCKQLPTSFALLEAGPSGRSRIAACVYEAGGDEEPAILKSDLHPIVPRAVRGAIALGPHLDRARADWPIVVAARGAMELVVQVREASERVVLLEVASRERVAEIERQRLLPPAEFRKNLLDTMRAAIAASAQELESRAFELLATGVAEVKSEWTAAIDSCKDRAAVKACIEAMQQSASSRFEAMLDAIGAGVLAEMQRVSETLQAHALDMVRAEYKRGGLHDDEAAAVFIEVPNELVALASTPLGTALATFEKRRVEMGIGGAAAGAMLGTALFPGIGTALGALVGVFAGFMEGTASLKEVAKAKAHAHVDDVAKQVAARFAASAVQFAGDIRASVEEMLDLALEKRREAIARAMESEAKLLAKERDKLARTSELVRVLATSDDELAALAQDAMRALRNEPAVPLPNA